jgi:nucleoside-diphosphate-sugar epimerase
MTTPVEHETLTGRRVLVTGASGFIGSHVVRRLLQESAQVFALTSSVSSMTPVRLTDVADAIEIVEANVNDPSSLEHGVAIARPELVVHLAAFSHVGKSFYRIDENIQTNVQGTVNLLKALDGDFARFVFVGTGEVYGDAPAPFRENGPVSPVSPYAVSKYAAERFCRMFQQAYDWPIICLRPFNTYGPWQSGDRIVPEIIFSGLQRKPLRMTGGRQTRSFTFVADTADAIVRALQVPHADGEVVNVVGAEETSMRDLALTILDLMGNPIEPEIGALPYRPTEIWRMVGDGERARELLDWQAAHSLEEGLVKTIDWYHEHLADQSRFLGA